jgi:hypothetical protein
LELTGECVGEVVAVRGEDIGRGDDIAGRLGLEEGPVDSDREEEPIRLISLYILGELFKGNGLKLLSSAIS